MRSDTPMRNAVGACGIAVSAANVLASLGVSLAERRWACGLGRASKDPRRVSSGTAAGDGCGRDADRAHSCKREHASARRPRARCGPRRLRRRQQRPRWRFGDRARSRHAGGSRRLYRALTARRRTKRSARWQLKRLPTSRARAGQAVLGGGRGVHLRARPLRLQDGILVLPSERLPPEKPSDRCLHDRWARLCLRARGRLFLCLGSVALLWRNPAVSIEPHSRSALLRSRQLAVHL